MLFLLLISIYFFDFFLAVALVVSCPCGICPCDLTSHFPCSFFFFFPPSKSSNLLPPFKVIQDLISKTFFFLLSLSMYRGEKYSVLLARYTICLLFPCPKCLRLVHIVSRRKRRETKEKGIR